MVYAQMKEQAVTRASLGIPDDALVQGSVGRLVAIKRYDMVLISCSTA